MQNHFEDSNQLSPIYFADYPDYSENFANYGVQVKYEDGEEKFKPSEDDRLRERENGQNYGHEEGEYDDRDYN